MSSYGRDEPVAAPVGRGDPGGSAGWRDLLWGGSTLQVLASSVDSAFGNDFTVDAASALSSKLSWAAFDLPGHGFHHHLVDNEAKGQGVCSPPGRAVRAVSWGDPAAGHSEGAALGPRSRVWVLRWLDQRKATVLKRERTVAEQGGERKYKWQSRKEFKAPSTN